MKPPPPSAASPIRAGAISWGVQLPVQSQSTIYVQPWEAAAGPMELLAVTQAAERAGALYVAVCDHAAIPRPLDSTMGSVWYDTVATLGWLAASTERIVLMSHVYVLPYRSPLLTAKAFATLDLLSEGRVILGVGAGHVEREFDLIGADFARRGAALDAAIDEVRLAFTSGEVHDAVVAPRSPRAGGPPIWVGGSSVPALRRAARRGDGWLPQGPPAMGMRAAIELIRAERLAAHGPDAPPIDLGGFTGPVDPTNPGPVVELLGKMRRMGLSHVQVRFESSSALHLAEQLDQFGVDVWSQLD